MIGRTEEVLSQPTHPATVLAWMPSRTINIRKNMQLTRTAIRYSLILNHSISHEIQMKTSPSSYTDSEKRALNAYTKLMRAAESVTGRINRTMAAAELTVSQFGVLEALFHKGPLCQRDIATKILKSTGNITMVIDNLERRGLVRRERAAEDRRFLTIYLTDEGQLLIAEVFPRVAAAIVEEMTLLTETEQEELGRLCRMLGLKERGSKGS